MREWSRITSKNHPWFPHSLLTKLLSTSEWNKWMIPGLVNIQKAIENGHRNSWFTINSIVIFHRFLLTFTRPGNTLVPWVVGNLPGHGGGAALGVGDHWRPPVTATPVHRWSMRILEDPMRGSNPIKVSFAEIRLIRFIRYDWIDDWVLFVD